MNAFVTQAAKESNAFVPTPSAPVAPVMDHEIDVLARHWQEAKEAEAHAKDRRLQVEKQITELVGFAEEGTTNAEGNLFKVKTVGKLTRSLDDKAIQSDWDKLPNEIKQCVNFKASLNTTKLRALETMRDDLVPLMAQYMTTKPAKPSVSVEVK